MSIPQELIEQIRQQSDIVDVIGEFVPLKKRGRNFIGNCPFHNEKTPSFNVSPEKQIYKCFGCGKAGNVYTFLMEYSAFGFQEAVEHLASRLGIKIDKTNRSIDEKAESKRSDVLKALETATGFFQSTLINGKDKAGLDFFYKRGFTLPTIEKFLLGFAPDSWDSLIKLLSSQGFESSIMMEAGLVVEKETGGHYDRFRNRAVFPIRDFMGRVVGFGARELSSEAKQAKYLNSPQSLVYDKSKVIYGLFEAKSAIRSQDAAIMAEGYADVISLHQAGIENAVASSGTALTPQQLDLLGKYTKNIFLAYDADNAGQAAAEKGLAIALEKGFNVKVVRMPAGEDPDSIVRNHGANTFRLYLRDAVSFVEFVGKKNKGKGLLDDPVTKAASLRSLLALISSIPDRLQHDFHIARLAAIYDLSENQIYNIYSEKSKYEKQKRDEQKKREIKESEFLHHTREEIERLRESSPAFLTEHFISRLLPEEKVLLKTAVGDLAKFNHMKLNMKFEYDLLVTDEARRIYELIESMQYEGSDDIVSSIMAHDEISSPEKDAVSSLMLEGEHPSEHTKKYKQIDYDYDWRKAAMDCVAGLKLRQLEKELENIRSRLPGLESDEEKLELMKRQKILTEQRGAIMKERNMQS